MFSLYFNVATDKIYKKELGEAIATGNMLSVVKLLEEGADVNALGYPTPSQCNCSQWDKPWLVSSLHIAVMCCQKRIAELLIDQGANVTLPDAFGYTPLIRASGAINSSEVVDILLKQDKADVNATASDGNTALIMASGLVNSSEIVGKLLDAGADVNAKNGNGFTALILAAYHGKNETVSMLLEHGADIDAKDNTGFSSLQMAARMEHTEVVKLLIDNGADRDGCFYNLCI